MVKKSSDPNERNLYEDDPAATYGAASRTKPKNDLEDIMQLMNRVKSKRDRLKKIGKKHRGDSSSSSTSSSTRVAIGNPIDSNAFPTSQQEHQNAKVRRILNAKARRIFKNLSEGDDDDNKNGGERGYQDSIEEGGFMDEDLGPAYDPYKEIGQQLPLQSQPQPSKRLWIIRIVAATILCITLILILIFVFDLGMRNEEATANKQQALSSTAPTVAPSFPTIGSATPTTDSNQTTIPPTIAPSDTDWEWTQACFQTTDELKLAVDEYLKDPSPDSNEARIYGWPIGSWCVSQLEHFKHVFSVTDSPVIKLIEEFNEPLDGWDFSSARSLLNMFRGAKSFNQDISMWNVSLIHDWRGTFSWCDAMNQNLSGWDMRRARTMQGMFRAAGSFEGIGLEDWSMQHVTNMEEMFRDATKFDRAIGSWNMSGVTHMSGVFMGATSFNQDLHLWRFSSALLKADTLFQGASAFNGRVDGWNWQDSQVTKLERSFCLAVSFNQPLHSWDVSNIENFEKLFMGATSFNQNLTSWTMTSAIDLKEMFVDAASFNGNVSTWDMSHVQTLERTFEGASSFNQPIDTWNVSSVTDMSFMFSLGLSFDQDLNAWDTGSVVSMTGMFREAPNFNGAIDNWDVRSVESMDILFENAVTFNQDLSNWNVGAVQEMGGIFLGAYGFNQSICSWLDKLDLTIGDSLFESRHTKVHAPPGMSLFGGTACPVPTTPSIANGTIEDTFCYDCSFP